jgi:NADPH-dependent curcumin reductase CurA
MHMVLAKRVHMHGFMVNDLMPKYQKDFYSTVVKWIADGEIKYNEYKYDGIDATNVALMEIQKGANLGKSYVKVANA